MSMSAEIREGQLFVTGDAKHVAVLDSAAKVFDEFAELTDSRYVGYALALCDYVASVLEGSVPHDDDVPGFEDVPPHRSREEIEKGMEETIAKFDLNNYVKETLK